MIRRSTESSRNAARRSRRRDHGLLASLTRKSISSSALDRRTVVSKSASYLLCIAAIETANDLQSRARQALSSGGLCEPHLGAYVRGAWHPRFARPRIDDTLRSRRSTIRLIWWGPERDNAPTRSRLLHKANAGVSIDPEIRLERLLAELATQGGQNLPDVIQMTTATSSNTRGAGSWGPDPAV